MARNIQNIKTTTTVIQQISNVIDVNSMRYLGYGTYIIDANTTKTFSGNVHFFFFVSGASIASFAIIYTVERKITTMSADLRNNWGSFSSNTIALPSKWRFGDNYPDATISVSSNSLSITAPTSSHYYCIASFRK